ncbi:hypothetical protein AAF712_016051 [Marasmius tenuissimus]|uniref:Ribonuclease H1 N-terminal domain-containing protein n=1 Tax=Marasmius tenuissimus TaxID=585030 RepID=A0ABR2Z6N7_9AGAR
MSNSSSTTSCSLYSPLLDCPGLPNFAATPKSTTRTKTHSRTIVEQSPGKVSIRTTTRTTTVVVTDTPSRPSRRAPPQSSSTVSEEDSDDPNDDAVIVFASATEADSVPPSPTDTLTHSVSVASPSRHTSQSMSSSAASAASVPAETDGEHGLIAYYEARYPGKVPVPSQIMEANARAFMYYVVTKGIQVGIFDDWLVASGFVLGVSGARHKKYRDYSAAWDMYHREYTSKKIRVLNRYQDTAPVHLQLSDNSL